MTPEQEEQCRLMFMAIQGPFEKHCPPDRKNFVVLLLLYKFCELMAYDEFLPCFALLKGRDKLFKQDSIFEDLRGAAVGVPPQHLSALAAPSGCAVLVVIFIGICIECHFE